MDNDDYSFDGNDMDNEMDNDDYGCNQIIMIWKRER